MKMEQQVVMKVSSISIIINILLSLFKLAAGIIAHSGAVISDAIHSASDVFSTIVVIVGAKAAGKESDKEHPYGHERMECVAAIVLAVMLLLTGAGIGLEGIKKIKEGISQPIKAPGQLAFAAVIISIVVKEWMYWYTRKYAKKIHSSALMADAWHHRSDAISSVGALIGILGARLKYPIFDPAASVIICIFIIKAAWDIFEDAMNKMVDKACDDITIEQIKKVVLTRSGVAKIDVIRTRMFGTKIYVELEISVDETLTLKASHQIAEGVHEAVEKEFPMVKHCMVHVNPMEISEIM